jgi:structural maintenance of chromosome 1
VIPAANGVGGTDLMDAISFVLGGRSFQLRGVLQGNSFYSFEDKDLAEQKGRVAYVKLVFRTANGEEIKFGRAITNSGTSEYRINNIPITWGIYNNTMKGLNILVNTPQLFLKLFSCIPLFLSILSMVF